MAIKTYRIPTRTMNGWIKKNGIRIQWTNDSINDPNYGAFASLVRCRQDMLLRFKDESKKDLYAVALLGPGCKYYDITVGTKDDITPLWYDVVGDIMFDEGYDDGKDW